MTGVIEGGQRSLREFRSPGEDQSQEGLGRFAKLLCDPRSNALLLQLRKVFHEHFSLQMIDLVLNANRKEALRFKRKCGAVLVVCSHFDALGPLNQLVDAGNGKAA